VTEGASRPAGRCAAWQTEAKAKKSSNFEISSHAAS